jgi:hypothetical protein
MFWTNISPPSSLLKSKPGKKPAAAEVAVSKITWCYNAEDHTLNGTATDGVIKE